MQSRTKREELEEKGNREGRRDVDGMMAFCRG